MYIGRKRQDIKERFLSKVQKTSTCWIWLAHSIGYYGSFRIGHDKIAGAHRVSYEIFKGEIPFGMEVDHLCRNKLCVNPEHLEAVTHKENVYRGINPMAVNKRKTHCKYGHEFTEDNLDKRTEGWRACRKCRIERQKQVRIKKRNMVKLNPL